ncbi:hypothetical protein KM043_003676 [Ampulex compressa]|nr:hypothetical protein KM043_003676 [Ampulex compressa]
MQYYLASIRVTIKLSGISEEVSRRRRKIMSAFRDDTRENKGRREAKEWIYRGSVSSSLALQGRDPERGVGPGSPATARVAARSEGGEGGKRREEECSPGGD